MSSPISDSALDQVFRAARTRNGWQDKDVPETLIKAAYELTKMAPTAANGSPARFVFLRSKAAKERLKPLLMDGNVEKTMSAPCVVIIASDMKYYERMDYLFPHAPQIGPFLASLPAEALFENALRNCSLQGGYFMLACRSLGLDCGPMSGFDQAGVDKEFFASDPATANWKSNFICNVGYGSDENLFPRSPRLSFEEACRVA